MGFDEYLLFQLFCTPTYSDILRFTVPDVGIIRTKKVENIYGYKTPQKYDLYKWSVSTHNYYFSPSLLIASNE